MNTVLQQINQHVSLTIDQSHDSWDDDQNQSKHLDEGQQDLCTSCHGHTPAVQCHHKRLAEQFIVLQHVQLEVLTYLDV